MRIKSLVDENQRYLQGVLEHQQLQDKYSLLENENNEIKKALLSFQDSCQLLTLKLNAANYEIELQNNELRVMRNEVTELRASCANMNQEMNHLQATHRELLNKIAMDTESIHNMKGSKLKLQNALKNLELENKLLHINYTALQSLECRSCHKSISQIYNESRQQEGSVEVVSTTKIGEDAFDTLPDELSQTDEIRQTESRLFEDSMKDMATNSRMMMNSSILLKSPEKKRENNAGCVSKSKATNSPPRGVSRNSKPARLKTPKLEAVVLPPTCAECRSVLKVMRRPFQRPYITLM